MLNTLLIVGIKKRDLVAVTKKLNSGALSGHIANAAKIIAFAGHHHPNSLDENSLVSFAAAR